MTISYDKTETLRAQEHGHPPLVYDARGNGVGEIAPTITGGHQSSISDYTAIIVERDDMGVINLEYHPSDSRIRVVDDEISQTLSSRMGTGGGNVPLMIIEAEADVTKEEKTDGDRVRRLTPEECEALQGYPTGWTGIGKYTDTNGKIRKTSDSARYKALGNSICTPFWFWLLRRISAQYERPATLGSLFDGISGFGYAWAKCNGSKTVLWASEIEEFPIAVCKRHFGDEETGEVGDIGKYL